jgi:hypothetical protein
MNIGCEWALYGYFSLWKKDLISVYAMRDRKKAYE